MTFKKEQINKLTVPVALFNLGDISQKFVLNITSEHPKI
jgi:hypothetical protein